MPPTSMLDSAVVEYNRARSASWKEYVAECERSLHHFESIKEAMIRDMKRKIQDARNARQAARHVAWRRYVAARNAARAELYRAKGRALEPPEANPREPGSVRVGAP